MTNIKPEKIYVLANHNARRVDINSLRHIASELSRHFPIEIIATNNKKDAIEVAGTLGSNPANIVVACGGDGTVNTILNALSDCRTTMGIIPSGTANVIARELGIPQKIRDALKLLLTGAIQKVDTGICNGKKFLFAAGFGFDAEVAASVSELGKKLFGCEAYTLAMVLKLFNYSPPDLIVECDGKVGKGQYVIVANMRRYGGELYFAPQARYDDNMLDVVILKEFNITNILKLLNFARKNGKFPKCMIQMRGQKIRIESNRPILHQLDGEVFSAEKEFEILLDKTKTSIITP